MNVIITNIPSSVTIVGSKPLPCEAQLISEIPPYIGDMDMTLESHGGDCPKAPTLYIPKDNSAFAHRGLARKKRR